MYGLSALRPAAFDRTAIAAGVGLCAVAVAFAIADRGIAIDVPVPEPVAWFLPVQILGFVTWGLASFSLRQRSDLAWSSLAAVAALSHALAAFTFSWAVHGLIATDGLPGDRYAAGFCLVLIAVEMPIGIFLVTSLPTGRLTAHGIDRVAWVAVGMATVGVVLSFLAAPDVEGGDFATARSIVGTGLEVGPAPPLLIAPAALIGIAILVTNWRRSSSDNRVALRWVVTVEGIGTLIVLPTIAFGPTELGVGVAQIASTVGLVALVTVIRRHHMLGVERVFEQTILLVLLTGALVAVYSGVIFVGSLLPADLSFPGDIAQLVAAVAVAIAVLPLRDRMSWAAARFVYGDHVNATKLINAVADRAATAVTPAELAERLLIDLVAGTRSAGAWIDVDGYGIVASTTAVNRGHDGAFQLRLRHGGSTLGHLTVVPPDTESSLDSIATRVATEIAPHVALVANAWRQERDLEQAKLRLIRSREEERRRIRHDLHDGLGPILTGVAFSADAVANLVDVDNTEARRLLGAARADVGSALDEIRRIVDDLRPPALDELGLIGAIRQHAQRLPHLNVTVSGSLPTAALPAAVEVAAYRIATEALTNAARHANATRAQVDASVNGDLRISVLDNGADHTQWVSGVGLTSMRERADELGGALSAGPDDQGGIVIATLPIDGHG